MKIIKIKTYKFSELNEDIQNKIIEREVIHFYDYEYSWCVDEYMNDRIFTAENKFNDVSIMKDVHYKESQGMSEYPKISLNNIELGPEAIKNLIDIDKDIYEITNLKKLLSTITDFQDDLDEIKDDYPTLHKMIDRIKEKIIDYKKNIQEFLEQPITIDAYEIVNERLKENDTLFFYNGDEIPEDIIDDEK